MNIAILTFDGFNELDSIIALGILNRMKPKGWNIQITAPSKEVTSMNGVTIQAQQDLSFANSADAVIVGSGMKTRDIAKDESILKQLKLDPLKQLICSQCSGSLILDSLNILGDLPVCTDLTTKPWLLEKNIEVLDQAFYAKENIASAGGCLSSSYLATWIIAKLSCIDDAKEAIFYVAAVGEKETSVNHHINVVSSYL